MEAGTALKDGLRKQWRRLRRQVQGDNDDIQPCLRRHNALYIHIPKCAGSSLSLGLCGYQVGHTTARTHQQRDPHFFRTAFKFTVVRHPFLRLRSAFHFLRRGGMNSEDRQMGETWLSGFETFDDFIESVWTGGDRSPLQLLHLRPMTDFTSRPGRPSRLLIDYAARLEFLAEDAPMITDVFAEPLSSRLRSRLLGERVNAGGKAEEAVDRLTLERVMALYEDDAHLFGYTDFARPEAVEALGRGERPQ